MAASAQTTASQVHRALSSTVRERLLEALRLTPEGQDIQELAEQLDLHVNTVRSHLGVLEEAELVVSGPEQRDRPGRPRLIYRATDDADLGTDDHGYRFLAEVLTSYLSASSPDPAGAAEEAGRAWGRHLVDRPAPFQRLEPSAVMERVVAMLTESGFAPELSWERGSEPADAELLDGNPRVLLRRCPFIEVAAEHQDVVCSIHLGLMRGALDELGGAVRARDLIPLVEPTLCVSHLDIAG